MIFIRCNLKVHLISAVTVGFSQMNYTVNEVDSSVTLLAMLLSGTLEREVTVQFSTVTASATETGMSMHDR